MPAARYAFAVISIAEGVVAFSRAIIICHSESAIFFNQFRTERISTHGASKKFGYVKRAVFHFGVINST